MHIGFSTTMLSSSALALLTFWSRVYAPLDAISLTDVFIRFPAKCYGYLVMPRVVPENDESSIYDSNE